MRARMRIRARRGGGMCVRESGGEDGATMGAENRKDTRGGTQG